MKYELIVVNACRFVLPKITRSCEWDSDTGTHYQLVLKNSALIAVNAYQGGDPIFYAQQVKILLLESASTTKETALDQLQIRKCTNQS